MKPPGHWITVFLAAASCCAALAREWTSADGKKTFEATFVAVQGEKLVLNGGGKPAAFPLTAFSSTDQQFAKNAQVIAETALKLGPQSWEFSHLVEDGSGWVCRLALQTDPKAATKLYTGETMFLVSADASKHARGERVENQLLFGAGGRTYHPVQGDPSMIRAFAMNAEHATQAWTDVMTASGGDTAKQAPDVIEPSVEIITRLGFGVVIGKGGLAVLDPEIAKKGFKSLVVHHDSKDYPAKLFQPKDKDGSDLKLPDIVLITSDAPVEPARIGTKRVPEVGHEVFALSYELNSTKKDFTTRPIVTRGIVSRFETNGGFQHDARLTSESPGGFVVGSKGDVFGLFFQTQAKGRTSTRSSVSDPKPSIDELGSCVSTQAIAAMLEKMPGQSALKSSVSSDDMEATGKALRASSVLVVATFEINKPRKLATAKAAATAPPGAGPPPAGWSLSKSGTRHNSKCRYYDAQTACQATDGKPCKVCGG